MRIASLLAPGFALLIGCAPDVRTTTFQQFPPKPADAPIKVFQFKSPECPFDEIGVVNSRQRNELISMDEVMQSLFVEARKLGGDAIIGLTETNPIHSVSEYGIDRDPVLSGTVIRFSSPDCIK